MAAFVGKIRDAFSDFWLEVELALGKVFKRKEVKPKIVFQVPAPAVVAPAPVVVSAKPVEKPVKTGADVKKPAKSKKLPWGLRLLRLGIRGRLFFFDQMATLIGSGVTLIDTLNLIRAQTRQKGLKKLYAEMIHHINAGMSLADTMRLFPHIFPRMQIALIEAGEKSGNLDVVLADIVADMETNQDFFRKVTGAMFYPVMLLILATTLVVGMLVFVIPRVAGMYAQANVELPALTQIVINISGFVRDQWVILLGSVFGGLLFLWLLFSKVRFGRLLWETLVSFIPLFGKISKEKNLMLIASNMAMLLKSGVLISESFEITEKAMGNLHYERALAKIRHNVTMGQSVSESMGLKNINDEKFKEDKLFPLQFAQLVQIGETTGTISGMLAKSRENYKKSVDYKLKNISTLIEPLMIFVVAFFVGSVLLAVMLPFFYIGTTIN
ncbi:MAG: type II secretion system F family protein [Candidatus Peregrinibacteria bacterium]